MSRLIETDQGLGRKLRTRDRQTKRDQDASPYSRSGLSVTAEGAVTVAGTIQSDDYDGTSPVALGTVGWALAKRADASSLLVLDGIDVKADLDAKDVAILGLIDELGDAQAALAAQQATLTAQQAALTAQQSALATEVARINDLVNAQVTGASAPTVTATGWSVTTGMVTRASTTIAVPAGYSRATVAAWASMHFMDSAPNGGWLRAVISGNAGGEMGGLANLNLGQTAVHSLDLTGLAGGTITLECQVRASVGTGGMAGRFAQIAGYASFFR